MPTLIVSAACAELAPRKTATRIDDQRTAASLRLFDMSGLLGPAGPAAPVCKRGTTPDARPCARRIHSEARRRGAGRTRLGLQPSEGRERADCMAGLSGDRLWETRGRAAARSTPPRRYRRFLQAERRFRRKTTPGVARTLGPPRASRIR